jgi:signal transduction histidine kinase/AmiR/NasT family two-component response regulator
MAYVLLIDDSKDSQDQVRLILEPDGHVLEAVFDARGLIRAVGQRRPDVILIDLSLPVIPAWEAIRELKGNPALAGIPVIALAGAAMDREKQRALAAGCDSIVAKPIGEESLRDALRRTLRSEIADEDTLTRPLAITTPVVRPIGKASLLLVAPETDFLHLYESTFRLRRYAASTETSPARVIDRLKHESFDLVLVDTRLPGHSAANLVSEVKTRFRRHFLPVLLLADSVSEGIEGCRAGADDFVSRPIDEAVLINRVGNLLLLSRALRAEQQRSSDLSTVARQMRSGLVLFDNDGRITLMNTQCVEMLGLPPEALEGRSSRHFFRLSRLKSLSGEPIDAANNPVARFQKGSQLLAYEVLLLDTPSGETRRIDAHLAAITNARGKPRGTSLLLRSASVDDARQRELFEAYERLIEVDQLKSKFLSTVSHELRTPLNTIILLSHLLTTEPSNGRSEEKTRHDLGVIRQSAATLLGMINNLLDLARIEAGQAALRFEVCSVRAFLEDTLSIVAPQAERKGLTAAFEVDDRVPAQIMVDAEKVRQILINLLSNAVKFTEKGRVELVAGTSSSGAALTLTIRDTGPGIPAEKLPLIFEPFRQIQTGTNSAKGSGLGLSIVKELVHLLGGEISVDSAPGRGTMFRVSIPFAPAPPGSVTASPVRRPVTLEPRHLLIVEDDHDSRYGLKSLLESEGFRADEAGTAREAETLLSQKRYDAVFMDISLPDADGAELIGRIRTEPSTADTPVVALTGATADSDRARIVESGATAYLSKPVDVSKLLDVLAALMGRGAASL